MPRFQHSPSRPGSHQQLASPWVQAPTLRHLLTISPGNVGRTVVWMIAFIVPGLCTWSVGIADVSEVPGRACANICASSVVPDMPDVMISDMREYWLPMAPLMFSHFGWAASLGGFRGSNEMWHEPHAVPMRNGGSIEPSARRFMALSLLFGSLEMRPRSPSPPLCS